MAAVVNPLEPWRIVIKAMGGNTGIPGKTRITINATTRLWTREANGQIAEWTHINASAGGPYSVEPVVIPANQLSDHLSGGSFYKLLEGPNKGKYVSFWSNEIGEPYPTGASKWGDITVETEESFDRGPGATLATFYQPAVHSPGASMNYNAAGELHFTLLNDDPNITIPLPKRTHYAVEFYRGGQWVEVFAGLIWNYSANEDTTVFYGIDYLGLTNFILDKRFNPARPSKPTPTGSLHVQKTISVIIYDMLTYAIEQPDSPVGFIGLGGMGQMSEKVSIYSTFANVLDFCVGLIESHRAGTGKMTRLSVDKNEDGSYTYNVRENPGVARDDLGVVHLNPNPGVVEAQAVLMQGFNVIPFPDDWQSGVSVIGRNRTGLKVEYVSKEGVVDRSTFGRIELGAQFIESDDKADLERRAKQIAQDASRLGKQVSFGSKLGSFAPFEGYDLCDFIPIAITRGQVDTSDLVNEVFGGDPPGDPSIVAAAYWTIRGVVFNAFDDGHWVTDLVLYPRGGLAPALVAVGSAGQILTSSDAITWTAQYPDTTGFPVQNIGAIRWSPELGIFVAAGPSGSIATSPNGLAWQHHISGWGAFAITDVEWSPLLGLFVAVGQRNGVNNLATSPDGMNWTFRSSGINATLTGVKWSPELRLFVIIGGDNGQLSTSSDGITWTARDSTYGSPSPANNLQKIAWSPELRLFVVVGDQGHLITSPDGITWTRQISGFGTTGLWSVEWSREAGVFLAVGDSGKVSTSPDGLTWTLQTSGLEPSQAIVAARWSGELGLFVVTTATGAVSTSPDGAAWTAQSFGQPGFGAYDVERRYYPVSADPNVPRTPFITGNGVPSVTDPTNVANVDLYQDRETGQFYSWSDDTETWTVTGDPGPVIKDWPLADVLAAGNSTGGLGIVSPEGAAAAPGANITIQAGDGNAGSWPGTLVTIKGGQSLLPSAGVVVDGGLDVNTLDHPTSGNLGADFTIQNGRNSSGGGITGYGGDGAAGRAGGDAYLGGGGGDEYNQLPAYILLQGGQAAAPGRVVITTDGLTGDAGEVLGSDGGGYVVYVSVASLIAAVMTWGEVPGGTINGVNADFTLAAAPLAGKLILSKNGMVQTLTEDYTVVGSTITFTAGNVPVSGDALLALLYQHA